MCRIKLYKGVALAYAFISAGNMRIPDGEETDCKAEESMLNVARFSIASRLPYNADKEINKHIIKAVKRCASRKLNHVGIFCMVLNFLPFVMILAENDDIIKDVLEKVKNSMLDKLADVDSSLMLATVQDADEYIRKVFDAI